MKKLLILSAIISSIPMGMLGVHASQENQENPSHEGFFSLINPFWQMPEIAESTDFQFTLSIPLKNEHDAPITPSGKVFIIDQEGHTLQNIGLINSTATSSGQLVDYLVINEANASLPEEGEIVFSMLWRGIGDQYIVDGKPMVQFHAPYEGNQEDISTDHAFWEKLTLTEESTEFTARVELSYVDPTTRVIVSDERIIPFSIQYPIIVRSTNTPLLVLLALTGILLLGLMFGRPKKAYTPRTRSTKQTFQELEAQLIEEAQKQEAKPKKPRGRSTKSSTKKK